MERVKYATIHLFELDSLKWCLTLGLISRLPHNVSFFTYRYVGASKFDHWLAVSRYKMSIPRPETRETPLQG